jgi:hypothetical protein
MVARSSRSAELFFSVISRNRFTAGSGWNRFSAGSGWNSKPVDSSPRPSGHLVHLPEFFFLEFSEICRNQLEPFFS